MLITPAMAPGPDTADPGPRTMEICLMSPNIDMCRSGSAPPEVDLMFMLRPLTSIKILLFRSLMIPRKPIMLFCVFFMNWKPGTYMSSSSSKSLAPEARM